MVLYVRDRLLGISLVNDLPDCRQQSAPVVCVDWITRSLGA